MEIADINSLVKEIKDIHNISTNTLNNLHNLTTNTLNHVLNKAE